MKDENCIFCKIANGEIPSATLYEDQDFRVILDLNPAAKGHALILPKEHYADLFALPEDLAQKAVVLAKQLGKKLCDGLGMQGYVGGYGQQAGCMSPNDIKLFGNKQ